MHKPFKERRKLLEENVKVMENKIHLSEIKMLQDEQELTELMSRVVRENLEGLIVKDLTEPYKPDKRHWLKVKKVSFHYFLTRISLNLHIFLGLLGNGLCFNLILFQ